MLLFTSDPDPVFTTQLFIIEALTTLNWLSLLGGYNMYLTTTIQHKQISNRCTRTPIKNQRIEGCRVSKDMECK